MIYRIVPIFIATLQFGFAQITSPLFGTVINVADNDVLNVRMAPNYRSRKTGDLPNGAFVGIDRCKTVGRSKWCRIHHIPQRDYPHFGCDAKGGWVNARFLDGGNRGYVLIDGKGHCAYALKCSGSKCLVATDAKEDKSYNVTSLTTKWISRDRLKGTNNFGAMEENGEGYCVFGRKVEDYLRHHHTQTKHPVKHYSSKHLSLTYPADLQSKKIKDGVTLSKTIPLRHISGSDMRDNPPVLHRRNIFNLTISAHPTLYSALKSQFPSYSDKQLQNDMHYDARTDSFGHIGINSWVESLDFHGRKAHRIMIGVEGSGVNYYFFKQNSKTIVVAQGYDHNPPLNPKTNKLIPGSWKLPSESQVITEIINSIRVKGY